MRYPFRLDSRLRIPLFAWGVVRRTAYVDIDEDRLTARFGWFRISTALANVERWEISGPYKWYRVLGVRGTIRKPEITFGGSTHGGVAVFFGQRVPFWGVRTRVLYLTVDDLEGFAAQLTRRGISGRDLRRA
jgi:hypothetical protein